MPFIDTPQRDDALPSMTSSPPRPVAPAYWLASPVMRTLDHAGAIVANAAADIDGDGRINANCYGVEAAGVQHFPRRVLRSCTYLVKLLVQLTQGRLREIHRAHIEALLHCLISPRNRL
jgi:hypothetical protein